MRRRITCSEAISRITVAQALGGRNPFLAAAFLGGLAWAACAAPSAASGADGTSERQVVVLYSYRTAMPVNIDWDRGIRGAFAAQMPGRVRMHVEHLDLVPNEDPEYARGWIDLLRRKYATRRIDLVIPVYDPALLFTLEHRDVLFPDAPIVFCTVSRELATEAHAAPNVTGVAFDLDFEGTVKIAQSLFPDTEHVWLIGGDGQRDQIIRDLARRALSLHEGELGSESLAGLPLADLLTRLAAIPDRTVGFLLTYDQDSQGNEYVTQEVVEQSSQASSAPIFGLWETLLGHGIIGGSLLSLEAQGREAGELAARVLRGEAPSHIPVSTAGIHQPMFDAEQLRRWRIRPSDLPAGSVVCNQQPTLWQHYGAYLIAGTLVLVVQTILIVALLLNRVRRRRAERELADRLRFETLISDLSSRFVDLPTDSLDLELERALAQITQGLGLERGSLFHLTPDGSQLQASLAWVEPGDERPPAVVHLDDIPWCWEKVRRGEIFSFTRFADLPAEAQREKQLFERFGLKSGLAIPLSVSTTVLGLVTFTSRRERQSWDDETVQRLKLVGQLFANALAHARADEALRGSRERARELTGRVLTAQEDERRRLAREMHDDLSQRLAATAIDAGKLERDPAESSASRAALKQLKEQLIALSEDVHRISRQLHPAILDDLGLEDALGSECDRFAERHHIQVRFHCRDLPERLPKEVALCLYRVAQEGLRNVVKHAQANRVEVVLNTDTEFVHLQVRDAGRGFDPGAVRGRAGLGLASMEERVQLVGGRFTVWSQPGQGTTVAASIPLPEDVS